MRHTVTQKELDADPFMHGTINSLQIALIHYAQLLALDNELPEGTIARLVIGELRDIQIISTDDRIVVQLAID